MKLLNSVSLVLMLLIHRALSGPIAAESAVSLCYKACNAGWVSCMWVTGEAAGATCCKVQAACMYACNVGGLALCVAPTP